MEKEFDRRAPIEYPLFMNDERQTPTYRKYAKNVGKLYWECGRRWDRTTERYVQTWNLLMISGLDRRWGRGCYMYIMRELNNSSGEADSCWEGRYPASTVMNWIQRGVYKPVDPNNPDPPPLKENV